MCCTLNVFFPLCFFLLSEQAGTVRKVKPTLKQTPLKEIFTSIPFLSLIVCHFGNMFLLFFYQNAMMIYLTKALGFKLTKGGVAAALPWLFRMVFGFFFSWAGDTLKKKKILSVTAIRKGATIFCKGGRLIWILSFRFTDRRKYFSYFSCFFFFFLFFFCSSFPAWNLLHFGWIRWMQVRARQYISHAGAWL